MSTPFQCNTCGSVKPSTEFYKNPKLRRGHNAMCKCCWDEKSRLYRRNNWPKCYQTRLKYKARNREKVAALARKSSLKVRYGITPEQYGCLLSKQNGLCAICGKPERLSKGRNLCVDHCHKTGVIRGLLCDRCNVGIGAFGDDPELILKAAQFIEAYLETL